MPLQALNPLNDSPLIFPALERAHIIGFALSIGTIALLDFRLGMGLLLITCGLLMAGCRAEEYYHNALFRTKMTVLALVGVHALIFRRGVYRNTAALDAAPRIPARAKLTASLSLILWTSLVIAGEASAISNRLSIRSTPGFSGPQSLRRPFRRTAGSRRHMLVYDPSTNPLNNNEWSFPLLEIIHIASFAVSVGTIAVVDLRLLGLGMRRQSSAQLLKDTAPWTLVALAIVLMSGPMIFSSDPNLYLNNPGFRFKMDVLLVAIVYNYTVHRRVAQSNPSPVLGALVGGVSLALWVSVVFGGLFIAFT